MRRAANFQRLLILGMSGPIIILNIWILSKAFRYFEHIITVLIVAGILAFLLNYPVQLWERIRLSRNQAVVIVLLLAVTLLVVLGLTLVPILIDQSVQLLKNFPAWLEASNKNIEQWDIWAKQRRLPLDLKGFSKGINTRVNSEVQALATQAFGFALGTLTGLLDTVLIIVLSFYMLLYGDRLWKGLINLMPASIGLPLSESLRLNFQKFFTSQLLLGVFMIGTLTPIFLVLKVPYSLLFALLIGIGELIPFIGATLGIGLVTILVMLQDFGLAVQVAIAAIIMQQIKDNLIAPRLLGNFTGLNPLWIFISLLLGGQIAGFLGVVVAVPIAGTIKDTLEHISRLRQPQVVTTEAVTRDRSDY